MSINLKIGSEWQSVDQLDDWKPVSPTHIDSSPTPADSTDSSSTGSSSSGTPTSSQSEAEPMMITLNVPSSIEVITRVVKQELRRLFCCY